MKSPLSAWKFSEVYILLKSLFIFLFDCHLPPSPGLFQHSCPTHQNNGLKQAEKKKKYGHRKYPQQPANWPHCCLLSHTIFCGGAGTCSQVSQTSRWCSSCKTSHLYAFRFRLVWLVLHPVAHIRTIVRVKREESFLTVIDTLKRTQLFWHQLLFR